MRLHGTYVAPPHYAVMAAPAFSRADREEERIEAELDRAQRLAATLNNPHDQAIIQRYIAELESRVRAWSTLARKGSQSG